MTDKRISDAIDALLNENTFAPSALKSMQAQLDKVRSLEEEVQRRSDAELSLKRERSQLEERLADARNVAERAEESAKKLAEADVRVAKAEATAQTYATCFELVFRNAQVHRSVTGSVPVAAHISDSGMSGSVYSESVSQTVTEEEK